jgi:uncharacterized cupredoxin-like copper-binding protein
MAGHSEGNLAAMPTNLPDLILNNDLTMSQTEYTLETGKYYRLSISSDGQEQFALLAPEFFRNVWLDKIEVDDLQIIASGTYSLTFDDEGTFVLTFVPIRPGRFEYWVDGYEKRGMIGAFMVN